MCGKAVHRGTGRDRDCWLAPQPTVILLISIFRSFRNRNKNAWFGNQLMKVKVKVKVKLSLVYIMQLWGEWICSSVYSESRQQKQVKMNSFMANQFCSFRNCLEYPWFRMPEWLTEPDSTFRRKIFFTLTKMDLISLGFPCQYSSRCTNYNILAPRKVDKVKRWKQI